MSEEERVKYNFQPELEYVLAQDPFFVSKYMYKILMNEQNLPTSGVNELWALYLLSYFLLTWLCCAVVCANSTHHTTTTNPHTSSYNSAAKGK
mmetsp:Transcript_27433/g.40504  ORF Transcript_27433/g.40504 Transcript_27433/m.40504 type:complete len:93 (-) Transcript_27433:141-419(-)